MEYHFDVGLYAFLLYRNGRLENRSRSHLGDLRVGNAEVAVAMAQHRIEFVQLLHPAQQVEKQFLKMNTVSCLAVCEHPISDRRLPEVDGPCWLQ